MRARVGPIWGRPHIERALAPDVTRPREREGRCGWQSIGSRRLEEESLARTVKGAAIRQNGRFREPTSTLNLFLVFRLLSSSLSLSVNVIEKRSRCPVSAFSLRLIGGSRALHLTPKLSTRESYPYGGHSLEIIEHGRPNNRLAVDCRVIYGKSLIGRSSN